MPSNEIWTLNRFGQNICADTHASARVSTIQQLQLYATVFRNVLASNQHSVIEVATYIPLIYSELPVDQEAACHI